MLLNVFRQPDSNTVAVADAVHTARSSRSAGSLPKGVALQPFYDQSDIVSDSIKSVRDAVILGLVLASLIMVLFLRDWGTSLVAGLVIPATLAVTFIVLRLLGESFNLMTLGGLAAAVGLVIDDAIVVVENIVMHRDSRADRAAKRSAARSQEIRAPLVGSTITPIVVFLPLDRDHRRHRHVFPRARGHRRHGAAHLAGARAHAGRRRSATSSSAIGATAARRRRCRQDARQRAAADHARLRAHAAHEPGAAGAARRRQPAR